MSNAYYNVNGSIIQTHCRFCDVSKGNNNDFMSLSALLSAKSSCLSQFPATRTVNWRLIEDEMYLKAFEDQAILDILTYLPDRVKWFEMTADPTTPNQNTFI